MFKCTKSPFRSLDSACCGIKLFCIVSQIENVTPLLIHFNQEGKVKEPNSSHHTCSQPNRLIFFNLLQHIEKVFKHKELQQQLMDTKLQRITEMMKEVEEKQQRERDFVSTWSMPVFFFLMVCCKSPVKPNENLRLEQCWYLYLSVTPESSRNDCTVILQLLKDATESRRKCELMKEQETQLKQQVSTPIDAAQFLCGCDRNTLLGNC